MKVQNVSRPQIHIQIGKATGDLLTVTWTVINRTGAFKAARLVLTTPSGVILSTGNPSFANAGSTITLSVFWTITFGQDPEPYFLDVWLQEAVPAGAATTYKNYGFHSFTLNI